MKPEKLCDPEMVKRVEEIIKRANGTVFSKTIQDMTGIDGAKVRDAVRILRRSGVMIGGGWNGYFIIRTKEQYDELRERLTGKADSMYATVRIMDGVAEKMFSKKEEPRSLMDRAAQTSEPDYGMWNGIDA